LAVSKMVILCSHPRRFPEGKQVETSDEVKLEIEFFGQIVQADFLKYVERKPVNTLLTQKKSKTAGINQNQLNGFDYFQ